MCSLGGVGVVLTLVACYYYCYCTLKKKILNVNFYKNEEMFKTDLNSDSKKGPDLKSRYYFALLLTDVNPNVDKYASICVIL